MVAIRSLCALALLLAASAGFAAGRSPAWAVPPAEQIPGLPNFFQVTPTLFRGAQPTAEGMRALEARGVKTVLSLRALHDDESLLPGTTLAHPRIRFYTWHPEDEDVVRFLRIVTDPKNAPVFVHCQHGSDRTGTMIAIYRIAIQRWDREEAMREMVEGGYGFHPMWENLKTYIRGLDIDAIRREAGIAP